MANFAITRSLKSEVEPQGLVDVFHDGVSYLTNTGTQPVNGNRAHLLCLSFGVAIEACCCGSEQDLKGIHVSNIRRHGNDRNDASTTPLGSAICPVVADQDSGALLVGLTAATGIEIDQVDLTPVHLAESIARRDIPERAVVIVPFL